MYVNFSSIGSITISSYDLMLMTGFISAISLAVWRAKKAGENPGHFYNLAIWIVISSLLGAKLYYIIIHYNDYAEKGIEGLSLLLVELRNLLWPFSNGQEEVGGLVIYGGIIAATAATIIYIKINKLPLLKNLDIIAPALGLGEFFGRIGCFLHGCCYGNPTSSYAGVVFPEGSSAGNMHPGVHIHPTQLYNSFTALFIMFALLYIDRHKKFTGLTAVSYFMMHSAGRFTIDFFRDYETRVMIHGLSHSQVLSIAVFISSAVLLAVLHTRGKKATDLS